MLYVICLCIWLSLMPACRLSLYYFVRFSWANVVTTFLFVAIFIMRLVLPNLNFLMAHCNVSSWTSLAFANPSFFSLYLSPPPSYTKFFQWINKVGIEKKMLWLGLSFLQGGRMYRDGWNPIRCMKQTWWIHKQYSQINLIYVNPWHKQIIFTSLPKRKYALKSIK